MTTVRRRTFGRTGWSVGELGVGMWGMGGWTGSNDEESLESLQLAVDLGCNFFDTALAYGDGKSERLLGELVRRNAGTKLYVATKVPPMNREWPSRRESSLDEVFPADYIRQSTELSLENLGASRIDLLQFHVWEDSWAESAPAQQRRSGTQRLPPEPLPGGTISTLARLAGELVGEISHQLVAFGARQ